MATKRFSVLWNVASAGIYFVIKRASDNYYWNGSGWQASATTLSSTEVATLDTNWIEYYLASFPTSYCFWWSYTSSDQMVANGEFDPTTSSIAYSSSTKRFSVLHTSSGAGVYLVIRRASDNYYWNGTSWQAAQTTITTTEAATLDSTWTEYYSTTAPNEHAFWWAYASSGQMLANGEYDSTVLPSSLPTFTVADAIKRSLRLIGVLAGGEVPKSNEYADALISLQMMLDTWSADSTMPPSPVEATHTLVAGTSDYTIGPSGDIVRARPTEIYNINIRSGNEDYYVWPVSQDEFYRIGNKALSARPTKFLFEQLATNSRIRFNSAPDQAYTLYMYLLDAFTTPTALTDALTFPPGYAEAIVYNLAVRLADEYQMPVRQTIASGAEVMLGKIRNRYVKTREMVTGFEGGEYDIYTDTYR